MNDTYTWLWIAWGIMFVVIEALAIRNRAPGDTLSEHLWNWFKIWEKGYLFRKVVLLLFLGWLAAHLFGLI